MMMMNGRKFICNIYDDEDREICINSFCEFIADLTQRGVTFRTTGKTRDGLLIFDVRY